MRILLVLAEMDGSQPIGDPMDLGHLTNVQSRSVANVLFAPFAIPPLFPGFWFAAIFSCPGPTADESANE
jgi:hypothetical protein